MTDFRGTQAARKPVIRREDGLEGGMGERLVARWGSLPFRNNPHGHGLEPKLG